MYLSKILISGAACRNPYEIHRALWRLFPADAAASRDFLFRVARAEQSKAEILMQSEREPDNSAKDAQLLASKAIQLSFKENQRLRFYLVANPAKKIVDEGGRTNIHGEIKKCRVPLLCDEDLRAWITRKFLNIANFETLLIDPCLPIKFRKTKEDRSGKIQPVCFQGVISVKDAASLADLVRNGIGPAKAFGCGLLSLAQA